MSVLEATGSGMTDKDGLAYLSANGWLHAVAPAFQAALLRHLRWRRFATGETVAFAGDKEGGIFGVAYGQIGMSSGIGPADSPIAHISLPGSWEGIMPLLGHPRYADSTAMTPTLVGLIPLAAVRSLLAGTPAWWEDILQLSVICMIRYGSGMTDLLIRDSATRCLAVLLRLGGCRFIGNAPVTVCLTQDQLAASANMSRNLAGEALRQAERAGTVRIAYGHVAIVDPAAIRALVNRA